jgi:cathepsin A (carboxypeptidase C)
VNTGFSWGNSCLTDESIGSTEFRRFLQLFLAKYPEFRMRDFYMTGESYAGKYLPLFTHDILEDNKVVNES